MNQNNPPRFIIGIFRMFCRPEIREDIEGDLVERYQAYVSDFGVRKARRMLTFEVIQLLRIGLIRGPGLNVNYQTSDMKKINWIKLVLFNLLVALAIISPFLPGPPNQFVIGASILGQAAAFLGVVIFPLGLIWLVLEYKRQKSNNENLYRIPIYILSIVITIFIAIVYFLFAAGMTMTIGIAGGLTAGCIGALFLALALRGIRNLRKYPKKAFNMTPLYLIAIPITALIIQLVLLGPLIENSRNRAIKKSEELIAMIEEYRAINGFYPSSIEALTQNGNRKIPQSNVMGVLQFKYYKIDDDYSISFSQWLEVGSLEELVLYDKSNLRNSLRGDFAKYDYGFDLSRIKAAFANYDTRYNNWRYYHLD